MYNNIYNYQFISNRGPDCPILIAYIHLSTHYNFIRVLFIPIVLKLLIRIPGDAYSIDRINEEQFTLICRISLKSKS